MLGKFLHEVRKTHPTVMRANHTYSGHTVACSLSTGAADWEGSFKQSVSVKGNVQCVLFINNFSCVGSLIKIEHKPLSFLPSPQLH